MIDIFNNLIEDNSNKFLFLSKLAGKHGQTLSGGQKQIVHLLRLMINKKNKIIILDEPTSALDGLSRNYVINYLKFLNSMGKTIIIITHDDVLKSFSDYILYFDFGKNPLLQ